VVRKMEEKYPKGMTESSKEDILRQPFIKASLEHGIKEMENTFVAPIPIVPQHTETKSVNKNAYEIRSDVLKMATEFFKWQYEMKVQIDRSNQIPIDGKDSPTSDKVLEMAQKFYKFVEQRR